MKTYPFHQEHLKIMDMRKFEAEKIYPNLTQLFLDFCSSHPYNYTLISEGRIITCIGFIPIHPGVFDIWQIPSIHVQEKLFDYARFLSRAIEKYHVDLKAHRFQSTCPDNELHNRWMKFIGFKCEGTLSKYGVLKENYKMWSKTWE